MTPDTLEQCPRLKQPVCGAAASGYQAVHKQASHVTTSAQADMQQPQPRSHTAQHPPWLI